MIEEVAGASEMEIPRLEQTATGSSSEDTYSDRYSDGTDAQGEGSKAVDPHESSRTYEFGPLTVTVGHIQ
jgi:hypothetical protein